MAKPKRSSQKIVTREAQIIRHMRVSRGISQHQAALACRCSEQAIGHYENGRMNISEAKLRLLLTAYDYRWDQFEEFRLGKVLPTDYRSECQVILSGLDEAKLKLIHGVLLTFAAKA